MVAESNDAALRFGFASCEGNRSLDIHPSRPEFWLKMEGIIEFRNFRPEFMNFCHSSSYFLSGVYLNSKFDIEA